MPRFVFGILLGGWFASLLLLPPSTARAQSTAPPPALASFRQDLRTPAMTNDQPAPGRRVRRTLPDYADSQVFHTLYLPTDWQPGKKFPVIFEYPGNGPYQNSLGDTNSGRVEDCNLAYGASGGVGFVCVGLPFVNRDERRHQLQWWGDVDATVAYCKAAVASICDEWGGDRSRLVLAGFSRGAIACNYVGLRDDEIAALWRGFIVHSHYDGVRRWPYADSDRDSAARRLARLGDRPQFVSHESDVEPTRSYLRQAGVRDGVSFVSLPFPNHTDTWVLRDLPVRAELRGWLRNVVK